jgi:hypothetical protein
MKALGLGLLLWAWGVSLAHAEPPRVYVIAHASDPALATEAQQAAAFGRFALAEAHGFEWQRADARVRGSLEAAHAAHRRALLGLSRGRQAYLRFELADAVATLGQALRDWEAALAVLDNPEPYADTLLYLGAAHLLAGDTHAAERVFLRHHVQFAELAPNTGVFNPEVLRHWESAGSALAQAGKGSLEVRVQPSTAVLSVDGVVRGAGSQRIGELAPGEHWVRISVVGGAGRIAKVQVQAGAETRLDLGKLEDSAALLDLFEHANRRDGAHLLSEELGLDALAVIEVRRGPTAGSLVLALRGFDGATGREGATFGREVGPDLVERVHAVRGLVAAWLDRVLLDARPSSAPVAAALPVEAPPPERARDAEATPHWARRWWVWTLAGGVLAGGALTAALLARQDGEAASGSADDDTGTLVLEF